MYYFTSDEHYGHEKIIEYCSRSYDSVEEMDEEIIRRHNSVVTGRDTVVHVGDFAWGNRNPIILRDRLNGHHIFVRGSHDKCLLAYPGYANIRYMFEEKVYGQYIAACHYPMRSWPRSHYASFHVFGHVHGAVYEVAGVIQGACIGGLSFDVGVDNNDFYPVDFDTLKRVMVEKAEVILESQAGSLLECYEKALHKLIGCQE